MKQGFNDCENAQNGCQQHNDRQTSLHLGPGFHAQAAEQVGENPESQQFKDGARNECAICDFRDGRGQHDENQQQVKQNPARASSREGAKQSSRDSSEANSDDGTQVDGAEGKTELGQNGERGSKPGDAHAIAVATLGHHQQCADECQEKRGSAQRLEHPRLLPD